MTKLSPQLTQLAAFLDAQPAQVQAIFQYCLCLMMCEAGKMELMEITPGENGPLCTFRTVAGDIFTVVAPAISTEQEDALIEHLRQILDEASS